MRVCHPLQTGSGGSEEKEKEQIRPAHRTAQRKPCVQKDLGTRWHAEPLCVSSAPKLCLHSADAPPADPHRRGAAVGPLQQHQLGRMSGQPATGERTTGRKSATVPDLTSPGAETKP
jgi:hypothetical protein